MHEQIDKMIRLCWVSLTSRCYTRGAQVACHACLSEIDGHAGYQMV